MLRAAEGGGVSGVIIGPGDGPSVQAAARRRRSRGLLIAPVADSESPADRRAASLSERRLLMHQRRPGGNDEFYAKFEIQPECPLIMFTDRLSESRLPPT